MTGMMPALGESIYYWMYVQGLKGTSSIEQVLMALAEAGHHVRAKDVKNFWNGRNKQKLYGEGNSIVMPVHPKAASSGFFDKKHSDYDELPWLIDPEIRNRFVPCNKDNKPMVKWGEGCLEKEDALAMPGCTYLAENNKGTKRVIIDCDGDHNGVIDLETIEFCINLGMFTTKLSKPKMLKDYDLLFKLPWQLSCHAASFHLTFMTDRIIPTMHFPYAHIDIIGNKCNTLRYFKNKQRTGPKLPLEMTDETWQMLVDYIKMRKERHG
jgi:hypothetical protein